MFVNTFGPVAIQIIFAVGFTLIILLLIHSVGPKLYNPIKYDTYECGVDYFKDARGMFSVKFYLVAVLFILFDIEAVFVVPWSVIFMEFKQIGVGMFILVEMAVFIGVLVLGYIYIIKKGALKWD